MYGPKRKIHFIGVGGMGMSGLAEILLNLGYPVSGSDAEPSEITTRLEQLGLKFFRGHNAKHVQGVEVAVRSAAIDDDNVEVVSAACASIPVMHRSDVLADLIRLKPNAVVVSGSHGKTTTTSMISAILDQADLDATAIVGGVLQRSGTNAHWGTGDYLVAEADEHDGSFLRLRPTIGVVTNIDAEHIEYYGTLDAIKQAFSDFCNRVPFYGYAVLCQDDANCRAIIPGVGCPHVTYGLSPEAGVFASGISLLHDESKTAPVVGVRSDFTITCADPRFSATGELGRVSVQTLGRHNVRNAVAACTVALCLGIPFEHISAGLASFSGVRRRLQHCGTSSGITVVEDYAHHPTEISATIDAIRSGTSQRIICVFQPHLFTRTQHFYREFAVALQEADRAIVTDIYPSREAPIDGVDASLICEASRESHGPVIELVRDMNAVPGYLAGELSAGDVVLVLGAGNINRIAPALLETIAGHANV